MSLTKFKEFLKKYKFYIYLVMIVLVIILVALIEDNNNKKAQDAVFTVNDTDAVTPFTAKETVNTTDLEKSIVPGSTPEIALQNTFGTPEKIEESETGLVYKAYNFRNSVTGVLHVVATGDGQVQFYSYTPVDTKPESLYIQKYSLTNHDFRLDPGGNSATIEIKVYLSRGIAIKTNYRKEVIEVWRFIPTDRDTFLQKYLIRNYKVIENTAQ